jgi:hypothetical protein
MPSSKRFHGWTKRRFLPFGSAFCGLTPEVALASQGTCYQLFIPDNSALKQGSFNNGVIKDSRNPARSDRFIGMIVGLL